MSEPGACDECDDAAPLDFDFSMAFQPIVDTRERRVFGYEALVRGLDGSGAAEVLARVHDGNVYRFDQACRVKAITLAARLGLRGYLSINFMPNAVYQAANCLCATLAAATRQGFKPQQLMFEIVEHEQSLDRVHLRQIVDEYRRQGFLTAIDDFGVAYSGVALLADFLPDVIKLDMELVRGIERDRARQIIVRHLVAMCEELGTRVLAEGVETADEWRVLDAMGVDFHQGYLFARPAFEQLPPVHWPQ